MLPAALMSAIKVSIFSLGSSVLIVLGGMALFEPPPNTPAHFWMEVTSLLLK